jgi:mRNA interferase RelE/StbE
MPYELRLTKTAKKVFSRLPAKLRIGLEKCFNQLEADPKNHPNIHKLKGYAIDYRYKVAGWRILYEINEKDRVVTVYEIRPRGDVYKHGH